MKIAMPMKLGANRIVRRPAFFVREDQPHDDFEHAPGDQHTEDRRCDPAGHSGIEFPPVDDRKAAGHDAETDHGADDRMGGRNR